MEIGSLFTIRRAFVMGAVAILTVLAASLAPVQAEEVPPDGGIDSPVGREWFHSTTERAETPTASDELTDGWLHSSPVVRESASYALTDGWLHSAPVIRESASYALTDGWLHSAPVVRESASYALTDGWLHSEIAESARDTAPQAPVASTSRGFPTEIAIASSLFALVLVAGGAMFLRRRHTTIAA